MITNLNIRKYLFALLGFLILVAITDIVLSQLEGSLSQFFNGYSVVIFPLCILILYIYIGFPLFVFDGDSELLHVRSHMVLNKLLGKELYVLRKNIVSLTIDKSGFRKKLLIRYIKNGKEHEERFGISILSKRKLAKLSSTVKNIDTALRRPVNPHMFI